MISLRWDEAEVPTRQRSPAGSPLAWLWTSGKGSGTNKTFNNNYARKAQILTFLQYRASRILRVPDQNTCIQTHCPVVSAAARPSSAVQINRQWEEAQHNGTASSMAATVLLLLPSGLSQVFLDPDGPLPNKHQSIAPHGWAPHKADWSQMRYPFKISPWNVSKHRLALSSSEYVPKIKNSYDFRDLLLSL